MKLEMLAKDPSSGKTGCETVYAAEDETGVIQDAVKEDYAVVQGNVLDAATEANLTNVLPGETAVSIKVSVLREALRAIDG